MKKLYVALIVLMGTFTSLYASGLQVANVTGKDLKMNTICENGSNIEDVLENHMVSFYNLTDLCGADAKKNLQKVMFSVAGEDYFPIVNEQVLVADRLKRGEEVWIGCDPKDPIWNPKGCNIQR